MNRVIIFSLVALTLSTLVVLWVAGVFSGSPPDRKPEAPVGSTKTADTGIPENRSPRIDEEPAEADETTPSQTDNRSSEAGSGNEAPTPKRQDESESGTAQNSPATPEEHEQLTRSPVLDSHQRRGGASGPAPKPREGAEKDLTLHTSETEDALKIKLLGRAYDKQVLARIKAIVNKPWSPKSVDEIWSITFGKDWIFLPGCIYDLMAYVATNTDNEGVSKRIIEHFDSFQDELGTRLAGEAIHAKAADHLWFAAESAITKYGDKRFITERFLRSMDDRLYRHIRFNIIEHFLDEDILGKVRKFEGACTWPEPEKQELQERIELWEAVLNNPLFRELPPDRWKSVYTHMKILRRRSESVAQEYIHEEVEKYRRRKQTKGETEEKPETDESSQPSNEGDNEKSAPSEPAGKPEE